ncbi:hypothetical protein JCM3770_000655 [Rhodotorula araucariae]
MPVLEGIPSVSPPPPRTLATARPLAPLVAIRARHSFQCSNAVTISALASLLSDLNSSREIDGRTGAEQLREDRIARFREDWLMGILARVRPLELLADDECDVYSDGQSPRTSAASAPPSVLTSSSADDDPVAPLPPELRQRLLPVDAVSRGVLAERTIKRALDRKRQLLRHKDYASLAAVARKAMRQTLRTGTPVYVAPGLLDSADWTHEYRDRGWAAPGIRFGVFKPDLIRFDELKRKGGETEERVVSWEVIEVKWSNRPVDGIYTNWKVQAGFYHLTLARLLSAIPLLIPSHKLSFFVSRDPLSSAYEERSLALRTTQAFVEQHLFALLPQWLEAVREDEWKRLQEALRTEIKPETPVKAGPAAQSFYEKLQASIRATPPAPGRARRLVFATPPGSSFSHPVLSSTTPPPSPLKPTSPLPSTTSFQGLSDARLCLLAALPPLPPPTPDEERDLLERLGTPDKDTSWSRSLRDSDDDSCDDSAPPPRLKRTRTTSSDADRFIWGSSADLVDIGLVSEPADLKFVETPFTLAKNTGARRNSAGGKAGGDGRGSGKGLKAPRSIVKAAHIKATPPVKSSLMTSTPKNRLTPAATSAQSAPSPELPTFQAALIPAKPGKQFVSPIRPVQQLRPTSKTAVAKPAAPAAPAASRSNVLPLMHDTLARESAPSSSSPSIGAVTSSGGRKRARDAAGGDCEAGRERVVLGTAVRSVRPVFLPGVGGVASGRNGGMGRGVTTPAAPRRAGPPEGAESAEARLRRLYRSFQRG